MERSKSRRLSGYCERHHIIPRCMGGNSDPGNIVRLTPEEHFVAHQLLVKMHHGHIGLVWALSAMCNQTSTMPRANKRYGWLRRRLAETLRARYSGKPLSKEHRRKLSEAAKARIRVPHSDYTKRKISAAHKGRVFTPEHRAKLAAAKIGNRNRLGGKMATEA